MVCTSTECCRTNSGLLAAVSLCFLGKSTWLVVASLSSPFLQPAMLINRPVELDSTMVLAVAPGTGAMSHLLGVLWCSYFLLEIHIIDSRVKDYQPTETKQFRCLMLNHRQVGVQNWVIDQASMFLALKPEGATWGGICWHSLASLHLAWSLGCPLRSFHLND